MLLDDFITKTDGNYGKFCQGTTKDGEKFAGEIVGMSTDPVTGGLFMNLNSKASPKTISVSSIDELNITDEWN